MIPVAWPSAVIPEDLQPPPGDWQGWAVPDLGAFPYPLFVLAQNFQPEEWAESRKLLHYLLPFELEALKTSSDRPAFLSPAQQLEPQLPRPLPPAGGHIVGGASPEGRKREGSPAAQECQKGVPAAFITAPACLRQAPCCWRCCGHAGLRRPLLSAQGPARLAPRLGPGPGGGCARGGHGLAPAAGTSRSGAGGDGVGAVHLPGQVLPRSGRDAGRNDPAGSRLRRPARQVVGRTAVGLGLERLPPRHCCLLSLPDPSIYSSCFYIVLYNNGITLDFGCALNNRSLCSCGLFSN